MCTDHIYYTWSEKLPKTYIILEIMIGWINYVEKY